jgi:flagellar protein FliS
VKSKRKSDHPEADNQGAMSTSGSNAYLRDAVLTATPEQLQLMLYDGAIRFATQGRDAVARKDFETSYERLSRAQKIILEMQNALKHDVAPDLCARMASLYDFIYRKLVDGSIHRDTAAIDDALKILHHQRETWVMLIDKLKREAAGGQVQNTPARKPPAREEVPVESTLCIEG